MRHPLACQNGESTIGVTWGNKMKTKEEVCEKNPELVITDSKSSLPIILLLYSSRSQEIHKFKKKDLQNLLP